VQAPQHWERKQLHQSDTKKARPPHDITSLPLWCTGTAAIGSASSCTDPDRNTKTKAIKTYNTNSHSSVPWTQVPAIRRIQPV